MLLFWGCFGGDFIVCLFVSLRKALWNSKYRFIKVTRETGNYRTYIQLERLTGGRCKHGGQLMPMQVVSATLTPDP